jgi:hypothetical protein
LAGFAFVNVSCHLVETFGAGKRDTTTHVIDHVADVAGCTASG